MSGQRLPAEAPKTRSNAIDATKGIGIVLVILGHVWRGMANAGLIQLAGAWLWMDRFVYAFHMPLFFVLSGVLAHSMLTQPVRQYAVSRLVRLGYPYLVWATLQNVIQAALSRFTNHREPLSDLWRIIYHAPMQFWFLYSLFIISVVAALALRFMGRGWLLILSIGSYVLAPVFPSGWDVLDQAREFLVFFVAGLCLMGKPWIAHWCARPAWMRSAAGVVGLACVAWTASVRFDVPGHMVASLFAAGSGVIGVFSLATFAATSRLAAYVGRNSLVIYVAHTIASAGARITLQKVLGVADPTIHLLAGAVAGLVIPLLLEQLSVDAKLPYLVTPPPRLGKPVVSPLN